MLVVVLGVHCAGAQWFGGGSWRGGDQAQSWLLRSRMMMMMMMIGPGRGRGRGAGGGGGRGREAKRGHIHKSFTAFPHAGTKGLLRISRHCNLSA